MNRESEQNKASHSSPESRPPAGDLHFYYSKEERLSLPSAPRSKTAHNSKKGFLVKNNFLFVILIDILIISVILLFYKGVITLPFSVPPYRLERGGYSFILRGLQLKDKTIASLTIKKIAHDPGITGFITVCFTGNKEEATTQAELPVNRNEEVELTVSLYGQEPVRRLQAEIGMGKDKFLLVKQISNE